MTSIARPGTPFPHAHGHSYFGPSSSTAYAYSPRPLHFQLPALPSPTPPSLLKRSASSSSSTSFTGREAKHPSSYFHAQGHGHTASLSAPATPPFSSRRESSSSASTSSSAPSPAMPSTPLIPPLSDLDVPELALPLTPPSTPTFERASLRPELELKQPTPTSASTFLYPSGSSSTMPPPPPPSTPAMPVRPALKRRDTPRPFMPTVTSFISSSPVPTRVPTPPEQQPQRQYTSVIDGGSWLILDADA
ncbi:hypothetical protein JCM24511_01644 [Saitozyma sp. JCM 24511]|nr:hypothetical protein JCM24511_01644 [Saitozyma sp. JCM 24511]